jgi:hypothetical protein
MARRTEAQKMLAALRWAAQRKRPNPAGEILEQLLPPLTPPRARAAPAHPGPKAPDARRRGKRPAPPAG